MKIQPSKKSSSDEIDFFLNGIKKSVNKNVKSSKVKPVKLSSLLSMPDYDDDDSTSSSSGEYYYSTSSSSDNDDSSSSSSSEEKTWTPFNDDLEDEFPAKMVVTQQSVFSVHVSPTMDYFVLNTVCHLPLEAGEKYSVVHNSSDSITILREEDSPLPSYLKKKLVAKGHIGSINISNSNLGVLYSAIFQVKKHGPKFSVLAGFNNPNAAFSSDQTLPIGLESKLKKKLNAFLSDNQTVIFNNSCPHEFEYDMINNNWSPFEVVPVKLLTKKGEHAVEVISSKDGKKSIYYLKPSSLMNEFVPGGDLFTENHIDGEWDFLTLTQKAKESGFEIQYMPDDTALFSRPFAFVMTPDDVLSTPIKNIFTFQEKYMVSFGDKKTEDSHTIVWVTPDKLYDVFTQGKCSTHEIDMSFDYMQEEGNEYTVFKTPIYAMLQYAAHKDISLKMKELDALNLPGKDFMGILNQPQNEEIDI